MASKKADGGKEQATGGFTLGDVTKLVDALEDSDVRSLLWTRGGEKIVIRRGPAPVSLAAAAAPQPAALSLAPVAAPAAPAPKAAEKAPEKPGHVVTSPFVGTFYRAPSPDSPAFADVGTVVKKGQVLCIVEAMKLMNEIEAEVDGKITEIFVLNATPVEFGEKLFRIEPA
ncbi:MAG: acetyl-CoA carboxylase biotin carboxyl carrier protein [Deltaproteobacteria bacterium]|nr:acetyl-CoA carboxylase biotin carboxyl carrier protein [Deltaproteobacteria bacterium]